MPENTGVFGEGKDFDPKASENLYKQEPRKKNNKKKLFTIAFQYCSEK
jgi:hypothetical protein